MVSWPASGGGWVAEPEAFGSDGESPEGERRDAGSQGGRRRAGCRREWSAAWLVEKAYEACWAP